MEPEECTEPVTYTTVKGGAIVLPGNYSCVETLGDYQQVVTFQTLDELERYLAKSQKPE